MEKFLLRSLMFVPGHNEKLMISAAKSEADVLLLDIEDSVQPDVNKQKARDLIIDMISCGSFKNHKVFPRVNDRESGQLLKDVYQLTIDEIDGFMYPKSKTGQDVYFFDKLLETIEYEKGIEKGKFKIIPLIETAGAVLNAQEICQASERVVAIAFGSEDFVGDLGGIHDKDSESLFTPRSLISMAARANDVIPIDTVHIRVHDLEDLEANIRLAKSMGYEGMLVLHPKELELVHRYFSPTDQEVSDAEEIIKLYKTAQEEGKGVAIMNGKFIGPPIVNNANKVIRKNNLIKLKKGIK